VPRAYSFRRLAQYEQDRKGLSPAERAVLAATLRLLAVDPTNALGIVTVWQDPGGWGEYLVDLFGWGALGIQVDPGERLVILRWITWY
jgi:hypothetical protein